MFLRSILWYPQAQHTLWVVELIDCIRNLSRKLLLGFFVHILNALSGAIISTTLNINKFKLNVHEHSSYFLLSILKVIFVVPALYTAIDSKVLQKIILLFHLIGLSVSMCSTFSLFSSLNTNYEVAVLK